MDKATTKKQEELKETLRTFEKALGQDEKLREIKTVKNIPKKYEKQDIKYNVFNSCEFWPDDYYQQIQRMSQLHKLRNYSYNSEVFSKKLKEKNKGMNHSNNKVKRKRQS